MPYFDLPAVEEGRNLEETVRNLFDTLFKFRKELQFILANIDSSNIGSIDGARGVLADPQKPRVEDVQDIVASTLKNGAGINIEYNDAAGAITIKVDINSVNAPSIFNVKDGDIGNLSISNPPTQSEVQALRDKCEMLADDCRALRQTVADLISKLKS